LAAHLATLGSALGNTSTYFPLYTPCSSCATLKRMLDTTHLGLFF
jgi:hypothetical protein